MYTPQIYSGTNVHANMPYCETRMKGLPTSIGVMCIHLPTTPFIYHPIHLPLAWRARLLGEGPCTLDKLRVELSLQIWPVDACTVWPVLLPTCTPLDVHHA